MSEATVCRLPIIFPCIACWIMNVGLVKGVSTSRHSAKTVWSRTQCVETMIIAKRIPVIDFFAPCVFPQTKFVCFDKRKEAARFINNSVDK